MLISRTEFYRLTLWKVASTRSKGRPFHWNGIKRKLLCPTVKSLCQDEQRRHTDYCQGTECICFTSLSEAIKTQHNTKYTFESGAKKKRNGWSIKCNALSALILSISSFFSCETTCLVSSCQCWRSVALRRHPWVARRWLEAGSEAQQRDGVWLLVLVDKAL